jgi:hypothetical protein
VGVQELWVGALAVALSGCLASPPDDAGLEPVPNSSGPDGGAGAVKDGAPVDAAVCADAFAVAYTSRFDVDPGGGVFAGVLVIAAVGDGVDLSTMIDEGDDSVQLELELTTPNYDPLPAGAASGSLEPRAVDLIVGTLVAEEAWTQIASPSFQLRFTTLAADPPSPHHATARLRVGDSVATLAFDLDYSADLGEVAVPTKAAMASSVCGG